MNNFTFGDDQRQYYETICGGAGATAGAGGQRRPHPHDQLAPHRPGDPRAPLPGAASSASACAAARAARARRRGGDGVVRIFGSSPPWSAALLSTRRIQPPAGLAGGMPGEVGRQSLIAADGR